MESCQKMQQISYRGQQKHELKIADARTLLGRLRQRALRLLQATKGWIESEDTTGQVGGVLDIFCVGYHQYIYTSQILHIYIFFSSWNSLFLLFF